MNDFRVKKLLSSWRFWAEAEPLLIDQLKDGLTNQSFLISIQDKKYVIRINAANTEILNIDRAQEVRALTVASNKLLAPHPFYIDTQLEFIVTEYVEGRAWNAQDIFSATNVSKLAGLLASIHNLDTIDNRLLIKSKVKYYKNSQVHKLPRLEEIEPEIEAIIDSISEQDTVNCMCHNDLLVANIIETPKGELVALDWEYAATGSPYFDLAAIIDGQAFDKTLIDLFISEYTKASANGLVIDPGILLQWRIVYCYLDCLWYTVQNNVVADNNMITEDIIDVKIDYLGNLLSSYSHKLFY